LPRSIKGHLIREQLRAVIPSPTVGVVHLSLVRVDHPLVHPVPVVLVVLAVHLNPVRTKWQGYLIQAGECNDQHRLTRTSYGGS